MKTLKQIQQETFRKLNGANLMTAGKLFTQISNEERNEALKRLDPENLAYALCTWQGLDSEKAVSFLKELNDEQLVIALDGEPDFCTASELEALRFAAIQKLSGKPLFEAVNSWFTDNENLADIRETALERFEGDVLLQAVLEWFNK